MNAEWRQVLLVCTLDGDGTVDVDRKQQIPDARRTCSPCSSVDELKKYLTDRGARRQERH